MRELRFLLGAAFVMGVAVLAMTSTGKKEAASDSLESVLQQLENTNRRLNAMEARLTVLSSRLDSSPEAPFAPQGTGGAAQTAIPLDIEKRLQGIEGELIALWSMSAGGGQPEQVGEDQTPFVDLSSVPAPSEPRSLAKRFDPTQKQSEWSKAVESTIRQAFSEGEFFAISRGDLTTDCRGSICRLELNIPDPAQMSPEELDNFLATAHLELIGLAGQSAQLVGRTDADIALDSDRPRIAVFIEQKSIAK